MKRTLKIVVLSVIITAMVMSTALGAQVKKTIEVVYNSVNITVNGKKVTTDNILYDGTTYVPLRAISEMLDKQVAWNGKTNTASIKDKKEPEPVIEGTLSQKNAIKSANNYLSLTAFSKNGLIKQLEFEGFSNADATYAVNQLNVNWKEQAVKSANNYLKLTAFSSSSLIKQLEFEGFSNADATYAVGQLDVNWKEQAVKSAEDYLKLTSFSRSGLIRQLEFEGFSNEDATYAVDQIGL